MNSWTKDRSISLSLCCVWIFAAILLAADISGYWLVDWFTWFRDTDEFIVLLCSLYGASVFAWVCLWCLRTLLRNIRIDLVFVTENVTILRRISWCCAGASVIFLAGTPFYLPLFIPAAAAAFMMLIVRVVKNVFQKACGMKDELDLTI